MPESFFQYASFKLGSMLYMTKVELEPTSDTVMYLFY